MSTPKTHKTCFKNLKSARTARRKLTEKLRDWGSLTMEQRAALMNKIKESDKRIITRQNELISRGVSLREIQEQEQ